MGLGELDDLVLVSLPEFVAVCDDDGIGPCLGLEYLDYFNQLERLLTPHEREELRTNDLPKLKPVCSSTKSSWRNGKVPLSVQAIGILEQMFRQKPLDEQLAEGLTFPITIESPGLYELTIFAAYAFFSGSIGINTDTKISVPYNVLLYEAFAQKAIERAIAQGRIDSVAQINKDFILTITNSLKLDRLCTLDECLPKFPARYAKGNTLVPKEGARAVGRLLRLLGLPMGRKSEIEVKFPPYIQLAVEGAKEDSIKEYNAWSLVEGWVKVMILCRGRRVGKNVLFHLFWQEEEEWGKSLCKEAEKAIACIFPAYKGNLHHKVKPRTDPNEQCSPGAPIAYYEPKVTFNDGAEILRKYYADDPRIVHMLS